MSVSSRILSSLSLPQTREFGSGLQKKLAHYRAGSLWLGLHVFMSFWESRYHDEVLCLRMPRVLLLRLSLLNTRLVATTFVFGVLIRGLFGDTIQKPWSFRVWDLLHMVLMQRTVQPCKDCNAHLIQANKTCRLSCNSLSTQKVRRVQNPDTKKTSVRVWVFFGGGFSPRIEAWLEERRSRNIKHISSTLQIYYRFEKANYDHRVYTVVGVSEEDGG